MKEQEGVIKELSRMESLRLIIGASLKNAVRCNNG